MRAALFCRRKTLWRQNSLICFRTGTQRRIPRCCRRRSCREHTGRSGGGVRKDIAGRRALPAASHQTQAVRSARDKRSCPEFNDLASLHPQLAEQWDRKKNGALTPEAVSAYSNRRVWWLCDKGHSFCAVIAHRVNRESDCPYCTNRKVLPGFNDLETKEPVIASQWHPTLNGSFTPQQVTPGSSRKAWWLCENGHAWKSVISSRTGKQRCGCPVCAGRPLSHNVRRS